MITETTNSTKIVVIMLTINQREKTLRALASFRSITTPAFHLLLWDNGSQDGTVAAVREAFPDVIVHYHPSNLGVASGRNAAAALAIKMFNPTHLLFIDNDMVVTPNFITALLDPFSKERALAQTQAKLRFLHDPQRLNDGGGCRIQFWLGRTRPIGYGEIDRGQYDQPTNCIACGGAMLVRADVFQQQHGFDVAFDPFGPEDLDFSLRLKKAGYYALYVPQAVAFHEVSHSFDGGGYTKNYARHKARHWFVFLRRHAPFLQQFGFVVIGAPYRLMCMLIREGSKGNLAALSGVLRGFVEFWRSKTPSSR